MPVYLIGGKKEQAGLAQVAFAADLPLLSAMEKAARSIAFPLAAADVAASVLEGSLFDDSPLSPMTLPVPGEIYDADPETV